MEWCNDIYFLEVHGQWFEIKSLIGRTSSALFPFPLKNKLHKFRNSLVCIFFRNFIAASLIVYDLMLAEFEAYNTAVLPFNYAVIKNASQNGYVLIKILERLTKPVW